MAAALQNRSCLEHVPFVAGVVLVHLLFVWLLGPYITGSDGFDYAQLAHDITVGTFRLTGFIYQNRLGMIYPMAGMYGLFGVSTWSTVLWPLLASLMTLVLVYRIALRVADRTHARIALVLMAFNPFQMTYARMASVDVVLAWFHLLGLWWLYRARREEVRAGWFGFLAAWALLGGLLAKEMIAGMLPLLIGLLILDARRRAHGRMWRAFIVTGVLLLAGYLGGYWIATGNPLFRFADSNMVHYDGRDWADYSATGSRGTIFSRLTVQPLLSLLDGGGLTMATVLALPAMLLLGFGRAEPTVTPWRFWVGGALSYVGFFWFGSTSLTHYAPVPPFSRMLLPALPVFVVLGSWSCVRLWRSVQIDRVAMVPLVERVLLWSMPFVLFGLVFVLRWMGQNKRDVGIAAVALLLPVAWLGVRRVWGVAVQRWPGWTVPAAMCASWMLIPVLNLQSGEVKQPLAFVELERISVAHLARRSQTTLLLTDWHSFRLVGLHLGFRAEHPVRPVFWGAAPAAKPDCRDGRTRWVLVHRHLMEQMHLIYGHAQPEWALAPPADWRLVAAMQGIRLYAVCGDPVADGQGDR